MPVRRSRDRRPQTSRASPVARSTTRRRHEHVGHAPFVRAGVHAHRAAERRRDLRGELEARRVRAARVSRAAAGRCTAPPRRRPIADRVVIAERASESDGDAAEAVVRHEQVRPASDDRDRRDRRPRTSATARRSSSDSASTRTSAGPPTRNVVNGASDASRRDASRRRDRAVGRRSSLAVASRTSMRPARRAARGCAGRRVVTSPAPIVRTTSPGCDEARDEPGGLLEPRDVHDHRSSGSLRVPDRVRARSVR